MLDSDLKSKLENIKKLLEANSITQSEYDKLKEEILFKKNFVDFKVNDNENTKNVLDKNSNFGGQYIDQRQPLNQNNWLISIILFFLMGGFWIWTSKDDNGNINSSTQINDTLSSSIDNNDSFNSKTNCKICGENFSGDGYDKIDGVWQKNTNMQTELCSQSCAMKEEKNIDEKYDEILRESGYNSSMKDAPIEHYGDYNEGSDGRIYESNKCGLCNGTGIEKNMSSLSDEYGRICPMCKGRGVRSY
jgi:hypothetical protein